MISARKPLKSLQYLTLKITKCDFLELRINCKIVDEAVKKFTEEQKDIKTRIDALEVEPERAPNDENPQGKPG